MDFKNKEELAEAVAQLIKQHPKVVSAVWECACQCPNLEVVY